MKAKNYGKLLDSMCSIVELLSTKGDDDDFITTMATMIDAYASEKGYDKCRIVYCILMKFAGLKYTKEDLVK